MAFGVVEVKPGPPAGPLVEWYDSAPPTNQSALGVQFWLGLTNGLGSLNAIIWDTNSAPHVISTLPQAITNFGWQHVALTYDTNRNTAVLYTNGQPAASVPVKEKQNEGRFVLVGYRVE